MFLAEIENTNAIRALLKTSSTIDCAVAFWGKQATEYISNRGAKIRIVCNLESGGTNPACIRVLQKYLNCEVKTLGNLHAKVIIGDEAAIVGSANISANGLAMEDAEIQGWIEAGTIISNPATRAKIESWFSGLWKKAFPVNEDMLKDAEKNWKKRRIVRLPPDGQLESIFDVLRDTPETLADRNIYLNFYSAWMSKDAVKTIKRLQKDGKYPRNVDAYEDWKEMPKNAYLIDVYVGRKGGVVYGGLFKSPEKQMLVPCKGDDGRQSSLSLVFKERDIAGYRMTKRDKDLLKSKAQELLNAKIGWGDKKDKLIPLLDARQILFG